MSPARTPDRLTGRELAWVAGACLVAVLHATRVFQAAISDDAYILYRYARHLAAGFGFVWNLGEAPVEGFTSFLDVVALAGARILGCDLVQAGQVLGVAFAGLSCVAAACLGREVGLGDSRAGIASAWIVALAPAQAAWARGGLETTLFTFLAAAAMAVWMWERRTASGRRWSSALFVLAVLARPEALALAALAVLLDFAERRSAALAWWPLCTALAILAVWKLAYFGDVLPNTYHAKSGGGLVALKAGASYVARFLRGYGWINLLLIAAPLVLVRSTVNARTLYLLLCAGMLALTAAKVGGDYQYFGRYLVPTVPPLAALTSCGALALWDATGAIRRPVRIAVAAGVCVGGALQLLLPSLRELHDRPWLLTRPWRLVEDTDPALFRPDFELMGKALARIAGPKETVAAIAVGAIGYYSDRPILDCLGLNDREIARLPVSLAGRTVWRSGHMKGSARVVLARRPAIIALPMRPTAEPCRGPAASDVAVYPWVGELLGAPSFRNGYQQRSDPLPDGRWMNYYVRDPAHPRMSGTRVCASSSFILGDVDAL
ncbi:MAG TPA: hypothetical protein VFV75_00770 [Candidatus Polarisedimenticolaceae bacterium]|nr:hypothetical protein [Candidatus Polarisedimenticolaceae bacterium]